MRGSLQRHRQKCLIMLLESRITAPVGLYKPDQLNYLVPKKYFYFCPTLNYAQELHSSKYSISLQKCVNCLQAMSSLLPPSLIFLPFRLFYVDSSHNFFDKWVTVLVHGCKGRARRGAVLCIKQKSPITFILSLVSNSRGIFKISISFLNT